MKTTFLNRYFVLIALLLAAGLNAMAEESFSSTKRKEFNQTFSVSSGDKLNIDNKYGNVTVLHWNKSEIAIRVEVIAKANSDSKAQEVLDRIEISLSKSGNTVNGSTSFKRNNINGNINQEINYYINMPAKNDIGISLKYGNIDLPDNIEGKASIDLKYGNIKAGNFANSFAIDSKYSKVTLGNLKNAAMDMGYSGGSIGHVDNLTIDTKYSNFDFRNVGIVTIDNKYGNIKMEDVKTITAETKYGDLTLRRLENEMKAEAAYSTITIGELNPNFKTVDISAKYETIKISIPSKASFRLLATNMKYGSVNITGLSMTNVSSEKDKYDYSVNGGNGGVIRLDGQSYSNMEIKGL